MKIAGLRNILFYSVGISLAWPVALEARFLQADPIGYDDQFNLYAYVANDPMNLVDPSGNRIVVAAHEVNIMGVPTGQYHLKIVIIPNNQRAYAGDNRFFTNEAGTRAATVGAGPENHRMSRPLGDLVSNVNRPMDISERSIPVADLLPGEGDTEDALINRILGADANYRDNLEYELHPSPSGGYNSNGFVTGLLGAIGAQNIPLPDQQIAPTPGAERPVPSGCFTAAQRDCN